MDSFQEDEGDEDIFGDLLDAQKKDSQQEDVEDTGLHFPFQFQQSTIPSDFVKSYKGLPPNVEIESRDHVLESLVFNQHVYALASQSGSCKVQVFIRSNHDDANKLNLLLEIPFQVNPEVFKDSDNTRRQHIYLANLEQEHTDPSTSLTCSSIRLQKQLFASLFGKNVAFTNSPVVMLSTNNGSLFSCPAKATFLNKPRFSLLCHFNSHIVDVMQVSTELMNAEHHNSELVTSLRQALRKDQTEATSDTQGGTKTSGLLVCCVTGECCLFLTPQKESSMPPVLKFFLPHSLVCCTFYENNFIYSTGSTVEACKLFLHRDGEMKCDGVESFHITTQTFSLLRKARIKHFLPKLSASQEREHDIYGITYGHDIVPIPLTAEKDATDNFVYVETNALKDISSNFEKAAKMKSSLQKRSSHLDSVIQQLKLFATVLQQVEASQKQKGIDVLCPLQIDSFKCHCKIEFSTMLYSKEWRLHVVCTNLSNVTLSEDWTLVITVLPFHCYFLSKGESVQKAISTSFQMYKGFGANSDIEVNVALQEYLGKSIPDALDVTISLVFNTRNVNTILYLENHEPSYDCNIEVAVHKQRFDILNFLWKADDGVKGQIPNVNNEVNKNKVGQDSHHLTEQKSGQFKTSFKDMQGQTISVQIDVPSSLVQYKSWKHPTDLMKFLMQDCEVDFESSSDSCCQLSSPFHDDIMFMIEDKKPHEENSPADSDKTLFAVILKSCDVVLLAASREAVKVRLGMNDHKFGMEKNQDQIYLENRLSQLNDIQDKLYYNFNNLKRGDHDASAILATILDQLRSVQL